MKNELLKVAIIDDGINDRLFKLESNLYVDENKISTINSSLDVISHATICIKIIKKYCKVDFSLTSLKIFEVSEKCHVRKLISAIDWCINNDIDIIHMSLGTINPFDENELIPIIDNAYKNNKIIISAASNQGYQTFPATLNNVIGVKADDYRLLTSNEFIVNHHMYDGIDFIANARHKIELNGKSIEIRKANNSFSAPVITAHAIEKITNIGFANVHDLKYSLSKDTADKNTHPMIYYRNDESEVDNFKQYPLNITDIDFKQKNFKLLSILIKSSNIVQAYDLAKSISAEIAKQRYYACIITDDYNFLNKKNIAIVNPISSQCLFYAEYKHSDVCICFSNKEFDFFDIKIGIINNYECFYEVTTADEKLPFHNNSRDEFIDEFIKIIL